MVFEMGIREALFGSPVAVAPPEYEARGEFTFADEVAATYFGGTSVGSIEVSEKTALGVTAWYRGIAILSGTIGGLPLKTYRKDGEKRVRVASWLDDPGGPLGMTPAEWVGQAVHYLVSGGEVFLLHIYDEAGRIVGAWPVHRNAIGQVERRGYQKWFLLHDISGEQHWLSSDEMTQVMLLSLDGLRGENPISLFRKGIAFNIAGTDASTAMMADGFHSAGLVTTEEDVDATEAAVIKASLNSAASGSDKAGQIAFVNRALKFTPWQMSGVDMEFLGQRGFGVEEVARMLGIPPHLLAQTEKQTSWGTGVAEQNLGLSRYTLRPITDKIEQALSRLLPKPRFAEFDYHALLQGTPADEIRLLIEQVGAGLLTEDEARAVLNLPPKPKDAQEPAPDPVAEDGDEEAA